MMNFLDHDFGKPQMLVWASVFLLFATPVGAQNSSTGGLKCLKLLSDEFGNVEILNSCNEPVDGIYRTERGGCSSTTAVKYPCSFGHLEPSDGIYVQMMGEDVGRLWAYECIYPMHVVEVQRGKVICYDSRKMKSGRVLHHPFLHVDSERKSGSSSYDHPDLKPYQLPHQK